MANQQGTGKHPHKGGDQHRQGQDDRNRSAQHRQGQDQDRGRAGHQQGGDQAHRGGQHQQGHGGGSDDLKSREYRDAQGNIHHHTRTYEEQHRNDRDRKK